MYTNTEFSLTPAQEKLLSLRGQFAYPQSGNTDEVNDIIEKVLFALNIYEDIPKYVFNRSLYPESDGETLKSARFVVRPSASHKLEINELKRTIVINAGEDFFDKLIEELAHFFDVYGYYAKLQENLNGLNGVLAEVIAEEGFNFDIRFTAGKGLITATDSTAVVGLADEVIQNIGSLPLFDGLMETRVEGYKQKIVDTLKEINKAYEILKVKTSFTKDLGIYSRKNTSKLIRSFVNRNAEHVRVGVGYIETEAAFAVVEKVAVTEEEAAEIGVEGTLVADNTDITKKEREAGKTKIVTRFLITPFDKEHGTPAELTLAELVTA